MVLVTLAVMLAAFGVVRQTMPQSLELLWTYMGNR